MICCGQCHCDRAMHYDGIFRQTSSGIPYRIHIPKIYNDVLNTTTLDTVFEVILDVSTAIQQTSSAVDSST